MEVPSTSPSRQGYLHTPLSDQKEQIRLLQIDSIDRNSHLLVTLSTFDRTSAPSYAALSYTWGDGVLSKTIACNGEKLSVTKNCWYALKQLRLFSVFDHYWVDSICINQADTAEKSAQVNAMGSTYRQADAVLVSLGRHTPASTYLFEQIITNGVTAHTGLLEDEIPIEGWIKELNGSAVERLLSVFTSFASMPYWSRVWTVQEFALPPEVFILCGNGCLGWDILSSFSAMLLRLLHINRDWFRAQSVHRYDQNALKNLPMNQTSVLRSTVRNTQSGLADFADLILRLGTRDCLDPRDRIFGILSLVRWPDARERVQADYSMAAAHLLSRALQVSGQRGHPMLVCRLIEMLEVKTHDSAMQALHQTLLEHHDNAHRHSQQTPDLPVSFSCKHSALEITGKEKIVPVAGGWDLLTYKRLGTHDSLVEYSMLVPNTTLPCDMIVQLRLQHDTPGSGSAGGQGCYDKSAFALRDQGAGVYEILGNVVFSKDSSSLSELLPEAEEEVDFELHLDPNDLVFWAWKNQDHSSHEVHSVRFDRNYEQLGTRFCHKPLSSYAMGSKRSSKQSQKDILRTAARLTQNTAAVRQKIVLLRIGG